MLAESGDLVKVAILMELLGLSRGDAATALAKAEGRVRLALENG